MHRIQIFDTTLRDGEQSPGVNLLPAEKLAIAHQLAVLGVDVIEAGFPITSDGDFQAVATIAREVRGPQIAALARTHPDDIVAAARALESADHPRIHIFSSFSAVHLQHMLHKSEDEMIASAVASIELARRYVDDVEFSGQDAGRADPAFVIRAIEAAIAAGATVINVPDTVGYTLPDEFAGLIRTVRTRVRGIERVRLSVHCHNDLGMATANTLAGLVAGAEQAEVAVNGIGERAGNTSLEEVAMAIATRTDLLGLETGIVTQEIMRTSRLVAEFAGMPVQPNKAIVGANAFAHESCIHQDGILKERTTYEIMDPVSVGLDATNLVLGKHSGRHAFVQKLTAMGYDLEPERIQELFRRFKSLTDRRKTITEEDVQALVEEEVLSFRDAFTLERFHVSSSGDRLATATVSLSRADVTQGPTGTATMEAWIDEAAVAKGPIEALFSALERASGIEVELLDYSIRSVGNGADSDGEAQCKVRAGEQTLIGRGRSRDVLEASARAYLEALNKAAAAGAADIELRDRIPHRCVDGGRIGHQRLGDPVDNVWAALRKRFREPAVEGRWQHGAHAALPR